MRMLVLGAGLQGSACAFDLLRSTDAQVTIADRDAGNLHKALRQYEGGRLATARFNAQDEQTTRKLLDGHDAAMSALPYYFNYDMARLAVEAGVPFSDLGGNTEIVRQQEGLHRIAREKGLSVMPDCGLAPGMINILAAEGIRRLDTTDEVRMYVGGLPQEPRPPLGYNIVYSLEGVLDYYTTPSWIVRDSKPATVEALSEVEQIAFPDPVGKLEAFHTAGGVSTMPWEFEGKVPTMEYKTLRYPGHAGKMRTIRELGLLDLEPVDVNGTSVRPRDLFVAVVDPKLRQPDVFDFVALRVVVRGTAAGRPKTLTFDLLDYYDRENGISAMMRTTGYSLSITGQMQVDGRITAKGVTTAYAGMPCKPYVEELASRGVEIRES